jgi:molybdopterin-binding protein
MGTAGAATRTVGTSKEDALPLRTSARNRLPGTVTGIKLGTVMAQVEVRVGDNHIVSVITREAAEELNLQEGDHVYVVVKSTEVMIAKEDAEGDMHAT